MDESRSARRGGRQAEAARNDARLLEAARAVFTANPDAPIAAVAARAGVGIGALYRRYRGKDELLRKLTRDGQARYIAETEAALTDEGDPWEAFTQFMRRVVDADTHALTLHLAGTFSPTEEQWREGERAHALTVQLLERTKAAGALRPDIEIGDLTLLFEQLAGIALGDRERTEQLRHRYLALQLQAMHAPGAAPLPGPGPTWDEINRRFAGPSAAKR
jgi:AcrR family transcriptional regulator